MATATTTVRGLLVLVPNPCTTQPCLPGLALAVRDDSRAGVPRLWYLQRHGAFVTEPGELQGRPPVGRTVLIRGTAQEKQDVRGESFATLLVDTEEPDLPGQGAGRL